MVCRLWVPLLHGVLLLLLWLLWLKADRRGKPALPVCMQNRNHSHHTRLLSLQPKSSGLLSHGERASRSVMALQQGVWVAEQYLHQAISCCTCHYHHAGPASAAQVVRVALLQQLPLLPVLIESWAVLVLDRPPSAAGITCQQPCRARCPRPGRAGAREGGPGR